MSGKGITGRVWFPHLIDAEGSDFVMPNDNKGYFYCGIAGWVLYVNGECLFEGYDLKDICDWLTMLGAQAIAPDPSQ